MAHILRLVSSAFTTISFVDASKSLLQFTPKPGQPGGTVTDTIEFLFDVATNPIFQTAKQAIERALRIAEYRYDNKRGPKVYMEFQPENYTAAYRTELTRPDAKNLCGMVELSASTLSWPWGTKKLRARLIFTHDSEWVQSAEEELDLGVGGDVATDGGVALIGFHGAAVFSANTVSFTAAGNIVADAGAGFAIFKVGQIISIRGSAAANDGVYTVATVVAAQITTTEPITANEAAGAVVSIYAYLNYVDIAADQVGGDLPAVLRMVLTNTNAAPSLETVWMGLNHSASPLDLIHTLEIGDSDTVADTVDAAASSGIKRTYPITAVNLKLTGWTLPSETLTASDGLDFRILARFTAIGDVLTARWQIKILRGTTVIGETGQVQFDDTYAAISRVLREIGTVQLPPSSPEGSTPVDLTLELWGQSTAGVLSVDIDCLPLLALDGWRVLRSMVGVAQNAVLVDDGINNEHYQLIGGEQVKDIVAQGDSITLWPNKAHRIYFLFHSLTANTAEIGRTASLRVYRKNRRLTF